MKLGDTPISPFTGQGTEGMTLRQYYAGLAMQGLLTCTMDTDCTISELCADAVTAADELLKELEK